MAYATPSNLKDRYDARRLGELVRDDGTKATPAQLDADTVLQAALDDGHSLINSAALAGRRYTPSDLADLTDLDKALLIRLNCDLAYGFLLRRRGFAEGEVSRLAPGFEEALQLLQRLKNGDIVFNVESVLEAGTMDRVVLSKNVTLVSSMSRLFGNLDIQQH